MKTFKNFFDEYSSNSNLHKAVWRAGGVDWKSFKEYPNDYYAANTGSVPGMIYYSDTVKFAKRYHIEILEELEIFNEETGSSLYPEAKYGEDTYYNWLAWFAWENMASQLINYLEG